MASFLTVGSTIVGQIVMAAGLIGLTLAPTDTPVLIVAALMAVFTILFGVRNVQASEQHRGMMLAIGATLFVGQFAFLFPALVVGMPPGLASIGVVVSSRSEP